MQTLGEILVQVLKNRPAPIKKQLPAPTFNPWQQINDENYMNSANSLRSAILTFEDADEDYIRSFRYKIEVEGKICGLFYTKNNAEKILGDFKSRYPQANFELKMIN